MTLFAYRATSESGELAEGTIEARDERSASDEIRNSGLILICLTPPETKWRIGRKSTRNDLLAVTAELSDLLGAGLPLDRSLHILSEISQQKEMRNILKAVLRDVREGTSLSEALGKRPDVFPGFYVNMIRAGETGGLLEQVLARLHEFLEASAELRSHILTAMMYPLILFATGILSIIILLVFVLPQFAPLFAEMGGALPVPTRLLLGLGESLRQYGWIAVVLFPVLWFPARNWLGTESGRMRWDALKLAIPGGFAMELEIARLCRVLGSLLGSGVPLLQALASARDVLTNRVIAGAIESASAGAKQGKGIAGPLAQTGLLPPLVVSMIKVGEETGKLDQMLGKAASAYERRLREKVKRFIGLLEPVLILSMGLVIGFIVISVLLAVLSLTDLTF